MKTVNFIIFIISCICFATSLFLFIWFGIPFLKYVISSSFVIICYNLGWLLGYSCGSSEEKAKNKPRLYLPLDEPNEHDEIAQIVEAQRIYANSKVKKVCKKCVNCKHFVNDNVCLYNGFLAVGSKEIAYRFNNCEHFKEKENENK